MDSLIIKNQMSFKEISFEGIFDISFQDISDISLQEIFYSEVSLNHHTHPCTAHPCMTLFSPMYCTELEIGEYALNCLGSCTAHTNMQYLSWPIFVN